MIDRHLGDRVQTVGFSAPDGCRDSYQKDVIKVAEDNCRCFYIRAVRSAGMAQQIGALSSEDWKQVRLGVRKMEVAELGYCPFGGDTAYRLVVSRDIFSGDAHIWRAILTNDAATSPEDIVGFYNKRGVSDLSGPKPSLG